MLAAAVVVATFPAPCKRTDRPTDQRTNRNSKRAKKEKPMLVVQMTMFEITNQ